MKLPPLLVSPLLFFFFFTSLQKKVNILYLSVFCSIEGRYSSLEPLSSSLKPDPDEEDSPIKQVALTVPTTDDPSLPVLTFRMWFSEWSCACSSRFWTSSFGTEQSRSPSLQSQLRSPWCTINMIPNGVCWKKLNKAGQGGYGEFPYPPRLIF